MDNIFGHVPRLGIMQIFDNAQRTHSNDRYLKNLFNIFSEVCLHINFFITTPPFN